MIRGMAKTRAPKKTATTQAGTLNKWGRPSLYTDELLKENGWKTKHRPPVRVAVAEERRSSPLRKRRRSTYAARCAVFRSERWRIAACRLPPRDPVSEAMLALAESNSRLVEAILEVAAERDDERERGTYLDGSPM